MATHYSSDLRHFLGPDGKVVPPVGPARRFADFLTSIVVAATAAAEAQRPVIDCGRIPKRRRCVGTIRAAVDPEGEMIRWACATCGTVGAISHWQNTLWDCRTTVRAS